MITINHNAAMQQAKADISEPDPVLAPVNGAIVETYTAADISSMISECVARIAEYQVPGDMQDVAYQIGNIYNAACAMGHQQAAADLLVLQAMLLQTQQQADQAMAALQPMIAELQSK